MKRNRGIVVLLLGLLTVILPDASAQIRVTSSNEPDFHFNVDDSAFFPIGWYNVLQKTDLRLLSRNGANVVLAYWNSVWETYGRRTPKPYNRDEYVVALQSFLSEVDSAGLKAIVDLGVAENGDFGFSKSGIARIVAAFAAHPAVFAWYLYDEPYVNLWYTNCNRAPTREYLQAIADTVRSVERRKFGRQLHPVFPAIADPRFFAEYNTGGIDTCKAGIAVQLPPPFYPSSYDAIGWDNYPFTRSMDSNQHWWRDFNDISRLTARRGVEQTRKLGKMAFVFVAQGADRSAGTDLRRPTRKEILYESLSPVIQGARGLLYWWWREEDTSPVTRSAINDYIKFFTQEKLDKVLMSGKNLDAQLALQDFACNDTPAVRKSYIWKNHNNLNRVIDDPHDSATLSYGLFNYAVRKYSGAYYLFVVNDYRSTVSTRFILDELIEPTSSIRRITELRVDGALNQPFASGARRNSGSFAVRFEGYTVKIFKIESSQ